MEIQKGNKTDEQTTDSPKGARNRQADKQTGVKKQEQRRWPNGE